MYNRAKQVQNSRTISAFIDAGGVAAAILTADNNTFVGVCIDTSSSLGMCAERNAIANMITNGESKITKVLAIMPDGKVGPPCGACREFMMQLDKDSKEIDVLLNYDTLESVKLGDLCPNWWTDSRFN
jgi:cytidine deaminase